MWLVASERLLAVPASPLATPNVLRTHLDNRYALDAQDLPFATRLQSAGVTTILALTSHRNQTAAPDLARDYQDLGRQGLNIVLLSLAALNQLPSETRR